MKKQFGKIDVLLNNSGIAFKGDDFDASIVETTFRTNFYGTVELSEKLLPLIQKNGKIIFVGSSFGKLSHVKGSPSLVARFSDKDLTRDQLFALAGEFYESVKDNTYVEKGWAKNSYGTSKLCINT